MKGIIGTPSISEVLINQNPMRQDAQYQVEYTAESGFHTVSTVPAYLMPLKRDYLNTDEVGNKP